MFLQSRAEVIECTNWLRDNGYISHGLSCKDWDLRHILPKITDGNIIDLGSDGSWILKNVGHKGLKGVKAGVDLAYSENQKSEDPGVDLIKGDILACPYPDGFFNFITCCSVVEHSVDVERLAKECSRLLCKGGKLFITADYWDPRPDTTKTSLYNLDWKILDKQDVCDLMHCFEQNRLLATGPTEWGTNEAVINDQYCSPVQSVEYTFCLLEFIKI